MSGLRVAYLIETLGAGGAERSLAESLPHLRRAGVEMRVFVLAESSEGFADLVRSSGTQVELLPTAGWTRRVTALRRRLREWRADLLHTSLYYADLIGRLAAIGSEVPVLSSLVSAPYEPERKADPLIRSSRLRAARWLDGWTGRQLTHHFHAVSEAAKSSAVKQLGLAPERITVIHRGRDPERFPEPTEERRAAARLHWKIADHERLIVSVGRHAFQKGQVLLLEAVDRLRTSGLQVRLVLAGSEGPSTEELHAYVSGHELGDSVHLPGHVADVAELLCAADLFAFPSRWEGFPGAVLEAIASGLPVVGTAIPPLLEMFSGAGGALLVEPESPPALADGVKRLLQDDDRRREMGREGRRLFLDRYDIEQLAPRTIDLYREVAGR